MLWGGGGGGGGRESKERGRRERDQIYRIYAYVYCEDIKWYDINKRIKFRYI